MININVTEILLYYKLRTVIWGYWSAQLKGKGIQIKYSHYKRWLTLPIRVNEKVR